MNLEKLGHGFFKNEMSLITHKPFPQISNHLGKIQGSSELSFADCVREK